MSCPENKTNSKNWKEYVPHRDDVLLEGVEVFNDFLVLTERENGLRRVDIRPWSGKGRHYINFEEEAYSLYSSSNPEMNTSKFRYSYSSMTTPNSVVEYDMISKDMKVLKETEVLGGKFDKNNYQIIDCNNLMLCPGFVDIKCHLRVPGEEHKENLSYASQSAASAGITSLVCMPNTDPIIDNVSMVELVQRKVRKESDVKIFSTASITKQLKGKELTEFGLLKEAGAVGFTDAIKAVDDATVMMRALKYASAFDMLLMQHPEEKSLSQYGSMNSGALSTKLGIKGIPEEAEVIQVDRDLRLAEMTNGRIHFFNITKNVS